MKSSFHTIQTTHADEVRGGGIVGLGVLAKAIGLLLLVAIVVFATFGNLPRMIVETHAGHDSHMTADSHHVPDEHDDDHHDDHSPSDSGEEDEHSHHHHHVEISPSLIIAVEALAETKVFRSISILSVSIPDEICPPSPFSEIVKPPQVA